MVAESLSVIRFTRRRMRDNVRWRLRAVEIITEGTIEHWPGSTRTAHKSVGYSHNVGFRYYREPEFPIEMNVYSSVGLEIRNCSIGIHMHTQRGQQRASNSLALDAWFGGHRSQSPNFIWTLVSIQIPAKSSELNLVSRVRFTGIIPTCTANCWTASR